MELLILAATLIIVVAFVIFGSGGASFLLAAAPILTPLLAFFATLSAAAIALIAGTKLVSKTKVSEFRQAWIDDLRIDTAEYVGKSEIWYFGWREQNALAAECIDTPERLKLIAEMEKLSNDARVILWRIRLRFNPRENAFKQEDDCFLAAPLDLLDPGKISPDRPDSSWRKIADDAVEKCREILKREWEVTKGKMSTGGPASRKVSPRSKLPTFLEVDNKPRAKSNFAQIASAFIAVVALVGILYQVNLNRENALRASARQVYLSYSQATLQYPRLAEPNYNQLTSDKDPTDLIRYKIYVANMLTAYDEILAIVDEPEWLSSFQYDIVDHMPYLCEQNDKAFYSSYSRKTRDLVDDAKRRYCSALSGILKSAPVYPPKL